MIEMERSTHADPKKDLGSSINMDSHMEKVARHMINLPNLMIQHVSRIYNQDKKGHSLAYRFWPGDIFEHLGLLIKIAIMRADHRDVILLIYGKYAMEQETMKAEIASIKSTLDREKETNSRNFKELYDLLKQNPPSSSTPTY
ncbi:hypothetical protein HAX54_023257 [Datura stramonium]|uniref:Uncharacterized protein n=1 Tax=Datura stramonium TaxID=4076 RepID=A0ABS8S6V4_DATST|nr:hypothetical protein [Datura stramonium]